MEAKAKPLGPPQKNLKLATNLWGDLANTASERLTELTKRYGLLVSSGDLILLDGKWYVTHSGPPRHCPPEALFGDSGPSRCPVL